MKELLDKLSSYNIFNFLVPGIVFSVVADELTRYEFIKNDLIVGAFFYYFIGLVISRIGSLVIEPILNFSGFIKKSNYSDFIKASNEDPKIELLSEVNNSYRTFCSLFICLIVTKAFEVMSNSFRQINDISTELVVILLFFLFLFSHKKQAKFINERVKNKVTRG